MENKASNKKIKLGIFVVGSSGGVSTFILNYFSRMSEKYSIDLITMHIESLTLVNKFKRIGIRVIKIPSKKESFVKNMTEMFKLIHFNQYDMVYAHMTLTNCFPLFVAWCCGVKVRISHSHLAPSYKSYFDKILSILTNVFCTDRLACGVAAGKYLYGKQKFEIINNAIDLNKYKFDEQKRESMRLSLKIPNNAIVLGNVGRLDEQKNQIFLLEIFKKFFEKYPNSYLIIVGEGKLKKKIKLKIKELGLENRVILTGLVDNVIDYLNVMDVFVLPSLFEGLSIAAIEAQANGLPCVFSNTVSKETALLKEVRFCQLNKNIDDWYSQIFKLYKLRGKINAEDQLREKNYDITKEAIKFDKWLTKKCRN